MNTIEHDYNGAKRLLSRVGLYVISTIDMGSGSPHRWETVVFTDDDHEISDLSQYHTEAEARRGHEAMSAKWLAVTLADEATA